MSTSTCPTCGRAFDLARLTQRFCSHACKRRPNRASLGTPISDAEIEDAWLNSGMSVGNEWAKRHTILHAYDRDMATAAAEHRPGWFYPDLADALRAELRSNAAYVPQELPAAVAAIRPRPQPKPRQQPRALSFAEHAGGLVLYVRQGDVYLGRVIAFTSGWRAYAPHVSDSLPGVYKTREAAAALLLPVSEVAS